MIRIVRKPHVTAFVLDVKAPICSSTRGGFPRALEPRLHFPCNVAMWQRDEKRFRGAEGEPMPLPRGSGSIGAPLKDETGYG